MQVRNQEELRQPLEVEKDKELPQGTSLGDTVALAQ